MIPSLLYLIWPSRGAPLAISSKSSSVAVPAILQRGRRDSAMEVSLTRDMLQLSVVQYAKTHVGRVAGLYQ